MRKLFALFIALGAFAFVSSAYYPAEAGRERGGQSAGKKAGKRDAGNKNHARKRGPGAQRQAHHRTKWRMEGKKRRYAGIDKRRNGNRFRKHREDARGPKKQEHASHGSRNKPNRGRGRPDHDHADKGDRGKDHHGKGKGRDHAHKGDRDHDHDRKHPRKRGKGDHGHGHDHHADKGKDRDRNRNHNRNRNDNRNKNHNDNSTYVEVNASSSGKSSSESSSWAVGLGIAAMGLMRNEQYVPPPAQYYGPEASSEPETCSVTVRTGPNESVTHKYPIGDERCEAAPSTKDTSFKDGPPSSDARCYRTCPDGQVMDEHCDCVKAYPPPG